MAQLMGVVENAEYLASMGQAASKRTPYREYPRGQRTEPGGKQSKATSMMKTEHMVRGEDSISKHISLVCLSCSFYF
jgi:hypothetical protein